MHMLSCRRLNRTNTKLCLETEIINVVPRRGQKHLLLDCVRCCWPAAHFRGTEINVCLGAKRRGPD